MKLDRTFKAALAGTILRLATPIALHRAGYPQKPATQPNHSCWHVAESTDRITLCTSNSDTFVCWQVGNHWHCETPKEGEENH